MKRKDPPIVEGLDKVPEDGRHRVQKCLLEFVRKQYGYRRRLPSGRVARISSVTVTQDGYTMLVDTLGRGGWSFNCLSVPMV